VKVDLFCIISEHDISFLVDFINSNLYYNISSHFRIGCWSYLTSIIFQVQRSCI